MSGGGCGGDVTAEVVVDGASAVTESVAMLVVAGVESTTLGLGRKRVSEG